MNLQLIILDHVYFMCPSTDILVHTSTDTRPMCMLANISVDTQLRCVDQDVSVDILTDIG